MIFDHTDNIGNNNITLAEKGKMEVTPDKRFLVFTLFNGANYYEKAGNTPQYNSRTMQRTFFKEQIRRIDLSELSMTRSDENEFKNNYQMLNLSQLSKVRDTLYLELYERQYEIKKTFIKTLFYYSFIDSALFLQTRPLESWKGEIIQNFAGSDQKEIVGIALNSARGISNQLDFMNREVDAKKTLIAKFGIEWQRKFTLSFACLILFFIGAPLGAIIRKGGLGMPVVFSTLFFIVFHIISISGEKFAREDMLTPFEGMWLSSLIFLPIGILLTYSATTDSKVLNTESWFLFFDKIKRWVIKSKKP
jgi:lipopolysaccharide export system permease protein